MLQREGWPVNAKKTYFIYEELGLQLRNKIPKLPLKAKLRDDRTEAVRNNDIRAMGFVYDQLATFRKLCVLTAADTFSHYVLILDVGFNYRGEDAVTSLDRVCSQIGHTKTIRVKNELKLIACDMNLWVYHRGVVLDFSRPGKPTDHAFVEVFYGKFHQECLNAHWFLSPVDAAEKLEPDLNTITKNGPTKRSEIRRRHARKTRI